MPNRRPTSALQIIATAPQKITRTAPRATGAPPMAAAAAPSPPSNTSELTPTVVVTRLTETNAAIRTGSHAPDAKPVADAMAA